MAEEGGSSSTESESDDEIPMKKARYVWEIKGRYRLKRERRKAAQIRSDDEDELSPRSSALITKWRYQQMAKAMFDNTVNSVIENMGMMTAEVDYRGSLEEEAVEMAIRSHGLQKPCSCRGGPSRSGSSEPCPPSSSRDDFMSQAVTVAIHKKGLHSDNHHS